MKKDASSVFSKPGEKVNIELYYAILRDIVLSLSKANPPARLEVELQLIRQGKLRNSAITFLQTFIVQIRAIANPKLQPHVIRNL